MDKVFTIGQVAQICKVAPRTASKWFDSGRLKGYRIPGSQDRRVPQENLIKFMKENQIPIPDDFKLGDEPLNLVKEALKRAHSEIQAKHDGNIVAWKFFQTCTDIFKVTNNG